MWQWRACIISTTCRICSFLSDVCPRAHHSREVSIVICVHSSVTINFVFFKDFSAFHLCDEITQVSLKPPVIATSILAGSFLSLVWARLLMKSASCVEYNVFTGDDFDAVVRVTLVLHLPLHLLWSVVAVWVSLWESCASFLPLQSDVWSSLSTGYHWESEFLYSIDKSL